MKGGSEREEGGREGGWGKGGGVREGCTTSQGNVVKPTCHAIYNRLFFPTANVLLTKFPYCLPSIVSFMLFMGSLLATILCLPETLGTNK